MNIPHSYQLFTARESKALDERTINKFGIDGFTLMEIAGTRAADIILDFVEIKSTGLFVCGKGNNAGDALVVARILAEHDIHCTIVFPAGTEHLSQDCEKNLNLLKSLERDTNILSSFDISAIPSDYDFIVDGILGTGLSSAVKSPYKEAIEWINKQEMPVFAMDVPSGLDADSGKKIGHAVNATFTFAFGTLKQGFYLEAGYDCCGEIIFCELPFPSKFKTSNVFLIDETWVQETSSPTKQRNHKYDGGVLYIIAGSEGLTGAAILAAKSAWSTGLGGVILITPKGLLEIYEKHLVQIIKKPVGSETGTHFCSEHLGEVESILKERQGNLLIGPGLGRHTETINFIRVLLSNYQGNAVIDADALFAISQDQLLQKPKNASWILTPHPGELETLKTSAQIFGEDRLRTAQRLARHLETTILAKGLPSMVISTHRTYITGYDTRVFSRAGFGDILAGKVAGFWLQENSMELASVFALLDGKRKAELHILASENTLEPLNII